MDRHILHSAKARDLYLGSSIKRFMFRCLSNAGGILDIHSAFYVKTQICLIFCLEFLMYMS